MMGYRLIIALMRRPARRRLEDGRVVCLPQSTNVSESQYSTAVLTLVRVMIANRYV